MKKRTTSRRQTQLDRIERKLDELLSRTVLVPPTPPPVTWIISQNDDTKQQALERIYRIAEGAFDAPSRDLEASMSRALDTIIGAALLAMGCNRADSTDVDAAFIRGGKEGGDHA